MNSELLKEINAAPRVALGSLLETVDVRGGTVDHNEIEGVNINKTFVPTVANLKNTDLSKYKHVPTFAFATNLMHIGRDVIFPVALNTSRETKFVSPAYFVFRIKDGCKLLPLFLLTLFRTSSFDRRVWFATDSSIRGNLTWDDMCRVKIPLPPIEVQRAYVDAYKGLTALIEENESLLKSLEATAQACVAECREKWPIEEVGSFLEETDDRNTDEELDLNAVRGISIEKCFIQTKADMEGVSLRPDKIISPREFAYVTVTSRNGNKISIAMNSSEEEFLVSSSYAAFRVRDGSPLEPEYLYLQFKRPEFDRYARFNSWGSARETFNWEDMCRVKIPLPPIEVQRAYVDAYKGLTALIEENESLLKSLEATAQACVAECREKWPIEEVGSFLEETDDRNTDEELDLNAVRGISIEKCFIQTKADMEGVSLRPDKIISPREFAYVTVTSRNGNKISIAMNSSEEEFLVSSSYAAFRVRDGSPLEPEYLYLQFKRPEFDRYARFNSWGSARETFNWEDMCRVKIPLPPIEVQRAIVALYHCAEEARKIAAEARLQLTQVCPAMIQRASHCR